MKLAQGEYVALERLENMYSSALIVSQIYVHGDSLQSFLVAVFVPDPVQFAQLATNTLGKKIDAADTSALQDAATDPKVNAAILDLLVKEAKMNGLQG
jgi:long-chain acyl-CoA synthetase